MTDTDHDTWTALRPPRNRWLTTARETGKREGWYAAQSVLAHGIANEVADGVTPSANLMHAYRAVARLTAVGRAQQRAADTAWMIEHGVVPGVRIETDRFTGIVLRTSGRCAFLDTGATVYLTDGDFAVSPVRT